MDSSGTVVRTGIKDKAFPAGPATWAWNGRTDAGAFAPRGAYRIVVAATNGTQGPRSAPRVHADAFRISTSAAAAVRGTAIKVTAVTAERLSTTPRVVVRQPGLDPWTVRDDQAELHDLDRRREAEEGRRGRDADPGRQGDRHEGRPNASTIRLALQ